MPTMLEKVGSLLRAHIPAGLSIVRGPLEAEQPAIQLAAQLAARRQASQIKVWRATVDALV